MRSYISSSIAFIFSFCAFQLGAQTKAVNPGDRLPDDPKLVQGSLKNGLRYYILPNGKPEKRLELRLIVNAGSMLEEDNQQGLAHFCEHMAFNGTAHFKKQELVDYIERIGMDFGVHLNAYTSFDETVYMLQVPADSAEILESAFQILEDWAHLVSYENEEIDKERGVVIEEWRTGLGAEERMREKYWPVLFQDSRYAERLPIGKKEVLDKFNYEDAKRFYRDWYRPDLMAVAVVGDADPTQIEGLIKKYFEKIETPQKPLVREEYMVPDQDKLRVSVESDKEAVATYVEYSVLLDPLPMKTQADFRRSLVENIYTRMLSTRLFEYSTKANAPFSFSWANYGEMVRTKSALSISAYLNAEQLESCIRTVISENKRAGTLGFTAGELERMKQTIKSSAEKVYLERGKTNSSRYIYRLVSTFLEGEAFISDEEYYELTNYYLDKITLAEVNEWGADRAMGANVFILVTKPASETKGVMSEDRVKSIYDEEMAKPSEPYVDEFLDAPLMAKEPKAGKIVSHIKNKETGAFEFVLSNGAKVIVKQTDFKNDEILLNVFSRGGAVMSDGKDIISARKASSAIARGGLGEFNSTNLSKKLAGKTVNIRPSIFLFDEGITGNCAPKDFETMMQLLYLTFTAPRKDEESFKAYIEQQLTFMQNEENNPDVIFYNAIDDALAAGSPWQLKINSSDLRKVNLDYCYSLYQQRFANAADFTFVLVGNISVMNAQALIERYIASLPSNPEVKEDFKNPGIGMLTGQVTKKLNKGVEPQSKLNLRYMADLTPGMLTELQFEALLKTLDINLRKLLREDNSGTYGVGVYGRMLKLPTPHVYINISFDAAPENLEKLKAVMMKEIKRIIKKGPSADDLDKFKEQYVRGLEVDLKSNGYWSNKIKANVLYDQPWESAEMVKSKLAALSASDVKKAAKLILKSKNQLLVELWPETGK